MYVVEHFVDPKGVDVIQDWIKGLKDRQAAFRVATHMKRWGVEHLVIANICGRVYGNYAFPSSLDIASIAGRLRRRTSQLWRG